MKDTGESSVRTVGRPSPPDNQRKEVKDGHRQRYLEMQEPVVSGPMARGFLSEGRKPGYQLRERR